MADDKPIERKWREVLLVREPGGDVELPTPLKVSRRDSWEYEDFIPKADHLVALGEAEKERDRFERWWQGEKRDGEALQRRTFEAESSLQGLREYVVQLRRDVVLMREQVDLATQRGSEGEARLCEGSAQARENVADRLSELLKQSGGEGES